MIADERKREVFSHFGNGETEGVSVAPGVFLENDRSRTYLFKRE